MWPFFLVVAIPLAVRYFHIWVARWLTSRRFQRDYGTKPPVKLVDVAAPQGSSYYKETVQAFKEHRMLELIRARHEAAGYTFQSQTLGSRIISTSEPENIKAILATKFEDYSLGFRLAALGPILGKGIFTTDSKEWETSRALIRPNFVKAQISNLGLFEKHINQLLAHIPKDGSTIDLQELFFKLSFDTSSELLFGQSVHSFTAAEDSEQARFVAAFDYAGGQVLPRLQLGSFLFLYYNRDFTKACKTVHNFVEGIIAGALADRQEGDFKTREEGGEKTQDNFLERLLSSMTDPLRLRSELLNILQAGRDTTAGLLGHVFWILARREDVWARLVAEVEGLNGRVPTYEELRGLTYLRCILNETLRLWPIAPINSRVAVRDTILPTGGGPDHKSPVFIPKGQMVSLPIYALHRRKEIYGPNANEFRPERWLDPHFRPGWAYIPFNGGPRVCIGQQFALTEAGYTIVRLVQTFGAVEKRDEMPYRECLRVSLSVFGGVKVGMIPR